MNQNALKQLVGKMAVEFIQENMIVGVGTGSTVNFFISALSEIKYSLQATIASSNQTEKKLKSHDFPVLSLPQANHVDIYIDGADAFNAQKQLIKGAGGALTREKILAKSAKKFICIVDESKKDALFKNTPVPVEVIPMARSLVAHEIVKLGGKPVYRENTLTDNGNIILDVYDLPMADPLSLEMALKQITGVVENGIFAKNTADTILVGSQSGILTL